MKKNVLNMLSSFKIVILLQLLGIKTNARNMGKKGSWFSAIKRVFIPHSKEKPVNVSGLTLYVYIINWLICD